MKLNAWQYAISKGQKLYPWQIRALEAFSRGYPTSVLTCNGAGKTTIVAGCAVDWFFKKHPKGWLVSTSSSYNQLKNQTWPAIQTKIPRTYKVTRNNQGCTIVTPKGGEGIGFATKEPGRAEGWHPKIDDTTDPVFILIDEAKTVPDNIWEAFDRCTYKYYMVISSAGPPTGRFYDSHTKHKKYFHTEKVDYTMCPHIKPSKVEMQKEFHGEDSPIFRSMMLAEFTDLDNHCMLTLSRLQQAINNQPIANTKGEKVAFFDFAAGGDENVFALREGNQVRIVEAWRDKNTTQAVRKFIALANANGVKAHQCWGDGDGIGNPMIDLFHDEGFRINSFRGGMAAASSDEYSNLISEVWIQGIRKIERGMICFDGNELDPVSKEQLTNRYLEWDARGKLRAERKEDMAKRGVKSPDRADAILGCIMCGAHMTGSITAETVDNSVIGGGDNFSVGLTQF